MANSLYQQLNPSQTPSQSNGLNMAAISQIKQMMNMMKGASNPQAMLMQMAQRNPQLSSIMQFCKSGGNPEALFRQRAQQMGLNPDDIINALKN